MIAQLRLSFKQLSMIVCNEAISAKFRTNTATKQVISRELHYKGRSSHHHYYGATPPAVSSTTTTNSQVKDKSTIMESQAEGLLGIAHLPVETLQQQEQSDSETILGDHSHDDSSIYSTEKIPEDSILALEMEEDRTVLLDSDEHYYLSDSSNKPFSTSSCDAMIVD